MMKSEATGVLSISSAQGSNPVLLGMQDYVALAVDEATMESTHGSRSRHSVSNKMELSLKLQNIRS